MGTNRRNRNTSALSPATLVQRSQQQTVTSVAVGILAKEGVSVPIAIWAGDRETLYLT